MAGPRFHFAVPYVFGNTSGLPEGADHPLAITMSSYWSSFAITGVPGGGQARRFTRENAMPSWPKRWANFSLL